MMRMRAPKQFAVVLATVVALAFGGQPAFADDGGGGSNVVQVNNERDGAWKTRGKLDVTQDEGPTVDDENVALARASCTDCRTVAVAVQAIIVEGPVTDFRPGNAAVAVNAGCVRCQTYAYARQEVLQAGREVDLSEEAHAQLAALRGQIKDVADADLPFDEMGVQLDDLTEQMVAVLQAEVDRAGTTAEKSSKRQVERDED